jgi:hypothetical protein
MPALAASHVREDLVGRLALMHDARRRAFMRILLPGDPPVDDS